MTYALPTRLRRAVDAIARSHRSKAEDLERRLGARQETESDGGSGQEAWSLEEWNGLLLELYGAREEHRRRADDLRTLATQCAEYGSSELERRYLAFLDERFGRITAHVERDHGAWTGLADLLYRLMDGDIPAFAQRVFEEHLSDDAIREEVLRISQDIGRDIDARWRTHLDELRSSGVAESSSQSLAVRPVVGSEMDFASTVLLNSMGGTAVATLALAAGWHTIWWSMGALVPPLLLAGAAATVAAAVWSRDKEREKVLALVAKAKDGYCQVVRGEMKHRSRVELGKTLDERASQVTNAYFEKRVGKFAPALLDEMIEALQAEIETLGAEGMFDPSNGIGTSWLRRAVGMFGRDELASALFACLAFEQLLRDVNRQLGVGFDFRVASFNRAFIDTLAAKELVEREDLRRLRRTKEARDLFTHRMHFVAGSGSARTKARDLVRDVILLRRHLLADSHDLWVE